MIRLSNDGYAERVQARSIHESSNIMSACHLHVALAAPRPAVPSIIEQVRADANGQLGADACTTLFSRLWRLASRYPGLNIELDMAQVDSVSPRLVRELAFLRRHVAQPWRRIFLTNVRQECLHLLEFFGVFGVFTSGSAVATCAETPAVVGRWQSRPCCSRIR